MPRPAAMMSGLVLVALLIGFNTARWPIVWRMACPAAPASPNESPQPPAPPAANKITAASTMPEKSLVPVLRVNASAGANVGKAAAVRRLPPVDRNAPPPAVHCAYQSFDGPIPVYPNTGIE